MPRERVNRVAGASAGSLIAAYYLMELPLVPCLKAIIDITEEIRKRPLGVFDRSHQIVDILPQTLDKLFPADAHKRVSGRLFVCMTRLKDMKKIIVSEFESKKDLIDALNCSCFIPVWSGNHVSTYKGVKHIDGGFSDNLPTFDEHTIRICCFAGKTDISPCDSKSIDKLNANILNTPLYINIKNLKRARRALFPPPAKVIVEMLERGFHDAKQFILNNDIIQCEECYNSLRPEEQIFSSLKNPCITPLGSPILSQNQETNPLASYATSMVKSSDGLLSVSNSPSTSSRKTLNENQQQQQQQHGEHSNGCSTSTSSGASSLDSPTPSESALETIHEITCKTSSGRDYGAEFENSSSTDREAFGRLLCDKLRAEAQAEQASNSGDNDNEENINNNEDDDDDDDKLPLERVQIELESDSNNNELNPISIVINGPDEEAISKLNSRRMSKNINVKALKLNTNKANIVSSSGLADDEGVAVDQDDQLMSSEDELAASKAYATRGRRPTLPANVPSQKFLERRRATVQAEGPLLIRTEKFKSVGEPLPSCPPSPNLDRHCNECIRMRQAARVDHLEETVRVTAARFLPNYQEPKSFDEMMMSKQYNSDLQINAEEQLTADFQRLNGTTTTTTTKVANSKRKLTRSLTSPLRWIKQTMGTKSQYSYTLEDVESMQHQEEEEQRHDVDDPIHAPQLEPVK